MTYDLFVFCGESSGDLLGSKILKHLDDLKMIGVIGREMRKLNIEELASSEHSDCIGFSQVITALPQIVSLFKKVKRAILTKNPKVVLLIDYVEFNLLLARALKKSGYKGKIVQLVSPSIWAWRKNRKKSLEKYFDLLLTIFPFEKKFFYGSPLATHYVGHPLFEDFPKNPTGPTVSTLKDPILALFPGSRTKELKSFLPPLLESTKKFSNYQLALSVAHEKHLPLITKLTKGFHVSLIPFEERYALMQRAEFALAKLGTVNLELVNYEVPTINVCRLPWLEQFVLQRIFKMFLPHYSLPNIIAGRRIFPEYICKFATIANIQNEIENFITNPNIRKICIQGCQEVRSLLQEVKAGKESAKQIRQLL